VSYAAAAGTKPADQGTATTAETGVGASFAPAGVSTSATVSVTADTDAADNSTGSNRCSSRSN
jgi:hypothetical protein